MAIAPRADARIRAVIFDLDEGLLVRSGAWQYAVEEAVMAVTGRRLDARPLAEGYRRRPFSHVLGVLVEPRELAECEELSIAMYRRSAMKRLLVHDGLGMALDALRGERVETGAVSHEPHFVARKQVESTGLDRFLAVLSATAEAQPWRPAERIGDCLRFLEQEPGRCLFVSPDGRDLEAAAAMGMASVSAGWAEDEPTRFGSIAHPSGLQQAVR